MADRAGESRSEALGGVRAIVVCEDARRCPLNESLEAAGARTSLMTLAEAEEAVARGVAFDVLMLAAPWSDGFEDLPERVSDEAACVAEIPENELLDWAAPARLDDVIVAGAGEGELAFRVRRAMERRRPEPVAHGTRHGDLVIDEERYRVTLGGEPVELTHKEFQLLSFLSGRAGRVCTRETILSHVWGYDFYGGTRTVDVHIRRLRSKIEDANHSFIDTVRNVGYRFHIS